MAASSNVVGSGTFASSSCVQTPSSLRCFGARSFQPGRGSASLSSFQRPLARLYDVGRPVKGLYFVDEFEAIVREPSPGRGSSANRELMLGKGVSSDRELTLGKGSSGLDDGDMPDDTGKTVCGLDGSVERDAWIGCGIEVDGPADASVAVGTYGGI